MHVEMRTVLLYALALVVTVQQVPPGRPPIGGTGGTTGRGGTTGQGRGAPPPPRPMNARTRSATTDAIERYRKGDRDNALQTLARLGGFDPVVAEDWIVTGSPADVRKRRLIAAVVALDYTASRPAVSPVLIDWAARTLGTAPAPDADERLWLRASVALIEGREAWPVLMGLPQSAAQPVLPPAPESPPVRPDPLIGHGHLAWALSRVTDDAHLKLAKVVAAEASTSPQLGEIITAPDGQGVVADEIDAQVLRPDSPASSNPAATLTLAAAALDELTGAPEVGAEAHLRRGYIALRLGHHDEALQHFAAIDAAGTKDPFVLYLGHMFAGWTLARDGHPDQAVREYRAALAVVPHARSVSALLTSLLLLNGRLDEAEQVATELMTKQAVGADPWLNYLLGDYREYPALMDQLRERIK